LIRYYLTPYEAGYLNQRPAARASKVVTYLAAGDRHAVVKAHPWKDWCIAWVNAVEDTHIDIQLDLQIKLIPIWSTSSQYLTVTDLVSDIDPVYLANMITFLEDHRIPTGWIQLTDTIGSVFKKIIRVLQLAQLLKENYPELNLDDTVGMIPEAQRNSILAWLLSNGISTAPITLSWTIRQLLKYIITEFGWQSVIKFGEDSF
jgi:hypothetical protein